MKTKRIALILVFCMLLSVGAFADWTAMENRLGAPSGVWKDGEILYVTDTYNKVVWKIEDGKQICYAGPAPEIITLEPDGYYLDGPSADAGFCEPWAIVPFLDGLAVSDASNHVVRYLTDEAVETLVGTGSAGSSNGTGTKASFNYPTGLALNDKGELLIADTGNGMIRKLATDGKVTTVVSGLLEPTGLAFADGTLYICETGKNQIVTFKDGKLTSLAGVVNEAEEDGYYTGGYVDGPIANAEFDHPTGIAVAEDGTVYVADSLNMVIRRIADERVYTLPTGSVVNVEPRGLLLDGENLYVADNFQRTLSFGPAGTPAFTDVADGAWYASAVQEAAARGIVNGMGDGTYNPGGAYTRAMFAKMLAKAHLTTDGSAFIWGETTFPDVVEGSWYENPVRWMCDLGIVSGVDGNFCPNDSITREQIVTFLYRYSVKMGYDVSVGEDTNILDYDDAASISEYAVPAMQWAVGAKVMSGYGDGLLGPKDTVTRAQAAQFILNFLTAIGY